MNGNPHVNDVTSNIALIEGMIGRREMYVRDGKGLIMEAQSRLAMAHEQRTANLINLLGTVGLEDSDYNNLVVVIKERLGLP